MGKVIELILILAILTAWAYGLKKLLSSKTNEDGRCKKNETDRVGGRTSSGSDTTANDQSV